MAGFMVLTATLALLTAASIPAAEATCIPECRCILSVMLCVNKGFTELPGGTWPSVKILDLSVNAITNINELGERFPALTILFMRNNSLSKLNLDAIAGPNAPPHLMAVDFSRNNISEVVPPSTDGRFNGLALIYLGSNRFTSLDKDTFRVLPRLEHLSLNDNPLVVSEGKALIAHPHLNALDLSRVQVGELSKHTFAELPSLTMLGLQGSGVRSIAGAFDTLKALDSLYLQDNEITEITAGSFSKEANLVQLSLERNPLMYIDTAALPVQNGGEVDIQDTPLACTCAYEKMWQWATERKIKLLTSCVGSTPCPFTQEGAPAQNKRKHFYFV